MRVLIAAISAASELSGVQRHAFNLAACLLKLTEISRVDLVVAPWQANMTVAHAPAQSERMRIHMEPMRNTPFERNAWFYCGLPRLARRLDVDMVHAAYPVPLRRGAFHCPVLVTLHDLYPYDSPRNFGSIKAWLNRRVLQQCLHSVDAVACVSDATLLALKRHVSRDIWQRASRIYNSVELSPLAPQPPPDLPMAGSPFLLCVAQHRYNKNIALVLRTFRRLLDRRMVDPGMRLLVVGIDGPETPCIHRLIEQLGLGDQVFFAEGVPEESLLWCYTHCAALVMPSLSEGFGLPAVEALLAGCKVVCSDIPALREVADHHCRFVAMTTHAVADFATAIEKTLRDPASSPVAMPQFSRAQIAREYSEFYRSVVTRAGVAAQPELLATLNNSRVSQRSRL